VGLATLGDYDGEKIVTYRESRSKPIIQIPAIEKASRLVNGGTAGLPERIRYYNTLKKEFMQIESTCINVDKIIKD
jgi:hypothetical protein